MSPLEKAARQALKVLEEFVDDPRCQGLIDDTSIALRQALEQPADEPVAFMMGYEKTISAFELERQPDWVKALWSESAPLYTRPQPAAQWVGLTEQEIVELAGGGLTRDERMIARAIEAKLRERNT